MGLAYTVLTAIGTDRVGIVDDISGAVSASSCNIEESKMAVLGGEFAIIMLISGAADKVSGLSETLPSLGSSLGLAVQCRPTREPAPARSGRPYHLEAVSLDTPGIVHAVTAVLRSHGVNIEDLETDTGAAPWTGAPMFRMKAHVVVEPGVSIPRLREALTKLQEQHDLDISLKPVFPLPEGE